MTEPSRCQFWRVRDVSLCSCGECQLLARLRDSLHQKLEQLVADGKLVRREEVGN